MDRLRVLSTTALSLLALTIPQLLLAAPAPQLETGASYNWTAYERGELGLYPQVTFQSSSASQPLIHINAWHEHCDNSSYTLLSPRGDRILGNKALILDARGELVWYGQEKGVISAFQVQHYKKQPYLTYWVGDDEYYGHGHGYYKMIDQSYTLAYTLTAQGGLDGDFHEFSITPDNTALITSYAQKPANLTAYPHGSEEGVIWDCILQEIDIETDELLFEWHASEHFKFWDMAVNSWQNWTGTAQDPWDWFHINSASKDEQGNFLVAGRYSNAITYINGSTGATIWNLGGPLSDFTDLTFGDAVHFIDPHMARFTDNGTAVTVFDNVVYWRSQLSDSKRQSHGVKVALDLENMIARLDTEYSHPTNLFGMAEGSMQQLDNGNYLLGFGSASVFSEFSPNGTLLCDSHYSPLYTNTSSEEPSPGYVQSYRVYKHQWHGFPKEQPSIKFETEKMHISWNGATSLRTWRLLGRSSSRTWQLIGEFPKLGFETMIDLAESDFSDYKVVALDDQGMFMRSWNAHPDGRLLEISRKSDVDTMPERVHEYMSTMHRSSAALFVLLPCLALLVMINFPNFPFIRAADLPAVPLPSAVTAHASRAASAVFEKVEAMESIRGTRLYGHLRERWQ